MQPASPPPPQVYKPPKKKRVVLLLETSARAASAYGSDFGSQVLHMLLDGLTVNQIARTMGCSHDLISALKKAWQTQVQMVEGENWQPRCINPRRVNNRPKIRDNYPV